MELIKLIINKQDKPVSDSYSQPSVRVAMIFEGDLQIFAQIQASTIYHWERYTSNCPIEWYE